MLPRVARTREDIRIDLEALAAKWLDARDSEKSAAQTFLNELVAAYTGAGVRDSGGEFERAATRDEGRGFIDMIWDGVVLVEMKAPKETLRLDQHRAQLLDYWRNSSNLETGTAAPPFAILCSIEKFEIWEPGKYPNAPVDSFTLAELPDRLDALLFLAGRKPVYGGPGAAVTRDAAEHMVKLFFQLVDREAASTDELHRFVMQTVWVLFAEDLGLLQERPIEALIQSLLQDGSRSTLVEFTDLFRRLNTQDDVTRNRSRPTPVPYVNGELFAEPAAVHLELGELEHLLAACRFDWRYVNPTVFGALMEGCLGHSRRWELGAHYTNEEDILSIVRPVIVHPWVERIDAVADPKEAVALVDELSQYRVLDPAMGCGNFLSIAFRELRVIEQLAHKKTVELHHAAGLNPPLLPHYSINNMYGIEIDEFAVEIAKVTLWMTQAIETRKYAESAENPLPLQPLSHLICADSLKMDWPKVNAIIGNPPFHGDHNLRSVVGDEYIDWLKTRFQIGVKDHCVYFFRKAHEELREGERCGFVATNTISQSKNRDASLGWIVEHGGTIFSATSTMPWSGEAKVHVSIVCWTLGDSPISKTLDGKPVEAISTSLKANEQTRFVTKLSANSDHVFQGYLTGNMAFVLTNEEAEALIVRGDADYRQVVYPFLNGEDIVRSIAQEPTRWVIDFAERSLEDAKRFPEALALVEKRLAASSKEPDGRWWCFHRPRPALRRAMGRLSPVRVGLCAATSKRLLFVWGDVNWRPSHACYVFIFDDHYRLGVLSSRLHERWARVHSSTLKGDLRYTPTTAFETFPFPPSPSVQEQERVAEVARQVVALRRKHCDELQIGLTKLYNLMDEGGVTDLKSAHIELDRAVAAAYGWDESIITDDALILDRLYDLNAEIAAGNVAYAPFSKVK